MKNPKIDIVLSTAFDYDMEYHEVLRIYETHDCQTSIPFFEELEEYIEHRANREL